MSAAVCRAVLQDNLGRFPGARRYQTPEMMAEVVREAMEREEEETERFDIWSMIQKDKEKAPPPPPPPPLLYVHPPVRRSSSLMSQKSLETCTENLGSETGSDGFSSGNEWDSCFVRSFSTESETGDEDPEAEEVETELEEETALERQGKKELSLVNYHCSIGRRAPQRSFPPPLPSISSRDGPCLKMRPHRCNGRLVVEAVPVPPRNYLHVTRYGGRLLLSFVDTSTRTKSQLGEEEEMEKAEEEEEKEVVVSAEEEDVVLEEEVEVVDRGTIVEVKVSTQPQPVSGVTAAKVHRSSLVINKFVVGSPLTSDGEPEPKTKNDAPTPPAPLVPPPSGKRPTTTAAAAAVAASSISTASSTTEGFHYNYLDHHHDSRWGPLPPAAAAAADAKLLFTSRRRSREELLRDMRRCSELRRPLFIFEQPSYWIATSS